MQVADFFPPFSDGKSGVVKGGGEKGLSLGIGPFPPLQSSAARALSSEWDFCSWRKRKERERKDFFKKSVPYSAERRHFFFFPGRGWPRPSLPRFVKNRGFLHKTCGCV